MKHYIAVLMPQPSGEWRAYLPDFPGCKAAGSTPDEAIGNTRERAQSTLDHPGRLPVPRSLGAIQADRDWATTRAIEWDKAVVSLVPIKSAR